MQLYLVRVRENMEYGGCDDRIVVADDIEEAFNIWKNAPNDVNSYHVERVPKNELEYNEFEEDDDGNIYISCDNDYLLISIFPFGEGKISNTIVDMGG
jgi:hypothetical protein